MSTTHPRFTARIKGSGASLRVGSVLRYMSVRCSILDTSSGFIDAYSKQCRPTRISTNPGVNAVDEIRKAR